MSALWIYRALLLIRGSWPILEWFFPWASSARMHEISLLHPYLVLFAQAIGIAFWLVVFAGLWFFRRWARLLFTVLLGIAVVYSVFRPYHPAVVPPEAVITIAWFMVMLNGAIVAMSFLPPVRDCFAKNET
jgi:hypothetical protein